MDEQEPEQKRRLIKNGTNITEYNEVKHRLSTLRIPSGVIL